MCLSAQARKRCQITWSYKSYLILVQGAKLRSFARAGCSPNSYALSLAPKMTLMTASVCDLLNRWLKSGCCPHLESRASVVGFSFLAILVKTCAFVLFMPLHAACSATWGSVCEMFEFMISVSSWSSHSLADWRQLELFSSWIFLKSCFTNNVYNAPIILQ